MGGKAAVAMLQTKVIHNKASSSGGGVVLESDKFDVGQIRVAVHGNQAETAPDIDVFPTSMRITNSSSLERFVSRLNSDEGLLDVTLQLRGAKGRLPSEGVAIVAVLDRVVLASATNGSNGVAHLLVKLCKPPGMSWVARVTVPVTG